MSPVTLVAVAESALEIVVREEGLSPQEQRAFLQWVREHEGYGEDVESLEVVRALLNTWRASEGPPKLAY